MMMMMMMNFSKSRRTTTSCYALLKVLLVASLAFVVSSANVNVNVNVKNGMGNTNTMPEDEKDVKRKLTGEDDPLLFTKTYIAVTKASDFVRLFPNGGGLMSIFNDFIAGNINSIPIQGSSTTQKGSVFDSSSIEVANAPDGVIVDTGNGDLQVQFAGNRKLRFTPAGDPAYFFHGLCTATSGILEPSTSIDFQDGDGLTPIDIPQPVITSQLCKLNLCLGGGGFSCIAIYSGSAFVFNFGKGAALNNDAKGGAGRKLEAGGNPNPVTFEAPPLPPPFPGTIIGGKD